MTGKLKFRLANAALGAIVTHALVNKDGTYIVAAESGTMCTSKRVQNTLAQLFVKLYSTGDFMKKVPTATCALRDRKIVSIEWVYTPSTFYMKPVVSIYPSVYNQLIQSIPFFCGFPKAMKWTVTQSQLAWYKEHVLYIKDCETKY